jgi:ariadne-1
MDSDDDFNSSMSGDDFDDQDSDLDLEEGAHPPAAAEDTC